MVKGIVSYFSKGQKVTKFLVALQKLSSQHGTCWRVQVLFL